MSKTYRNHLINTVNDLVDILMKLDINIINLAMSGEFAEVDAQFEIGDTLRLDVSDFENIEDQNVQQLIRIFHLVFEANNSLRNINGLSNDRTEDENDPKEEDDPEFPF